MLVLDLDEVVVDFSKYIVEVRYNKDFNDNISAEDNMKYYWEDCKKAPKSYFEKILM